MESQELNDLVEAAKLGDENALAMLFSQYKSQLRRMIAFRMDQKLKGRVDPSDVLQEAFLDLAKKLPEFGGKKMPFFVWLRLVTKERMLAIHREHMGTKKRDVRREFVQANHYGNATSISLAAHFLAQYTSVAGRAIRAEQKVRLEALLEQMTDSDREIIALRIFEGLTNGETSQVLGLTKQTASKRFLAAISRLREELKDLPGFV